MAHESVTVATGWCIEIRGFDVPFPLSPYVPF
jgi:hypothetical protein